MTTCCRRTVIPFLAGIAFFGCFDTGTNNPASAPSDSDQVADINDSCKGTWDLYDENDSLVSTNSLVVTDDMFGIVSGQPGIWKLVAQEGQVYIEAFSNGEREYYYDYALDDNGNIMYLLTEDTDTYTAPARSTSGVLILKKQ
ncbi:MAG: hypothetical protein GF350_17085 [Chitinivibrionales bacterium]|nr:hypothetical protein [Chitinivibrionales bacterium]